MKNIESFSKFVKRVNEEGNAYMFWQNLETMKHAIEEMLVMDKAEVEALLENGHGWAIDHIATSADDVEEVYHFIEASLKK